jgi:hypothetical protein
MLNERRWLRVWARIYVKPVVFQYPLIIFPLGKIYQVILAHDNPEVFIGMSFREVYKGVNRITRFWKMELYVGRFNFIMIVDGCPNHVVSIKFVKESLAWLKRILRRNHHPNLVKVSGFRHNISDNEVPDVDGIEGTEEETNFHVSASLCPFTMDLDPRNGMWSNYKTNAEDSKSRLFEFVVKALCLGE